MSACTSAFGCQGQGSNTQLIHFVLCAQPSWDRTSTWEHAAHAESQRGIVNITAQRQCDGMAPTFICVFAHAVQTNTPWRNPFFFVAPMASNYMMDDARGINPPPFCSFGGRLPKSQVHEGFDVSCNTYHLLEMTGQRSGIITYSHPKS